MQEEAQCGWQGHGERGCSGAGAVQSQRVTGAALAAEEGATAPASHPPKSVPSVQHHCVSAQN